MIRTAAVVTALFLSGALLAGDEEKKVESGVKKGGGCSPFQVVDITGPNKGKQLCYVWQYGNAPVALVFTTEIDKGLTSLVKEIDKTAQENSKSKAFIVLLSENNKENKEKLEKLAKDNNLKIPLTINAEGKDAPAAYKVNSKVKHTVLIYSNKKVENNFALNEISDDSVKEIAGAAKKVFQG